MRSPEELSFHRCGSSVALPRVLTIRPKPKMTLTQNVFLTLPWLFLFYCRIQGMPNPFLSFTYLLMSGLLSATIFFPETAVELQSGEPASVILGGEQIQLFFLEIPFAANNISFMYIRQTSPETIGLSYNPQVPPIFEHFSRFDFLCAQTVVLSSNIPYTVEYPAQGRCTY